MIEARELTYVPAQRATYRGEPIEKVSYFAGCWRSPAAIDKARLNIRIRQAARQHVAKIHGDELAVEKASQMERERIVDKNAHKRARERAVNIVARRYPKEMLFWIEVQRASLDDA